MNQKLKELDYKMGGFKRKMKIKAGEKLEPGDLIKRSKEIKNMPPKKRTAFMGLV